MFQAGPQPGAHAQPGAGMPPPLDQSESGTQRVTFPDGRELVIAEIVESRFNGLSLNVRKDLHIQGLDCRCTIQSVLEACQCARCGAIVCKKLHAVTCSFCGTQTCTSCCEIVPGPEGGTAIACQTCLEACKPDRLTRIVQGLLDWLGL